MQYGARRLNLAMAIKNDIAGWTPQLRDRKIEQLTSVIATMNTGLRSRSARRVRGRKPFRRRSTRRQGERSSAGTLGLIRLFTSIPTRPAESMLRSSTTTPCPGSGAARRVGVLPRGDAPPRHPWDLAGQFQHHNGGRPELGRRWYPTRPCTKPQHIIGIWMSHPQQRRVGC
jgi:hypothetical protein